MVNFEPSITVSSLISFTALVFTAGGVYYNFKTFTKELSLKANKDIVETLQNQFNAFQNNINLSFFNKMAEKGSPLKLNAYAEKILQEIEFMNKIFPAIRNVLLNELEKHELRTPYDVQEQACIIVRQKREDSLYDEMKKAIYKTGNNLDEVLAAISIPLRNYYFEKHPEIID